MATTRLLPGWQRIPLSGMGRDFGIHVRDGSESLVITSSDAGCGAVVWHPPEKHRSQKLIRALLNIITLRSSSLVFCWCDSSHRQQGFRLLYYLDPGSQHTGRRYPRASSPGPAGRSTRRQPCNGRTRLSDAKSSARIPRGAANAQALASLELSTFFSSPALKGKKLRPYGP